MMIKKFLAVIFALVGIASGALAIHIAKNYTEAEPMLLTPPNVARSKVVMLMDAVCDGDYAEASQTILGNPDLGADREAADAAGVMIWEAFLESLSYELVGECYTTENGLAQDIRLTGMDIESVTVNLRQRAHALLDQRVLAAEDPSTVYDENNEYREDFVMAALHDAVIEALAQDAEEKTVELTINLIFQDGSWWIVADSDLLDAISGGILY